MSSLLEEVPTGPISHHSTHNSLQRALKRIDDSCSFASEKSILSHSSAVLSQRDIEQRINSKYKRLFESAMSLLTVISNEQEKPSNLLIDYAVGELCRMLDTRDEYRAWQDEQYRLLEQQWVKQNQVISGKEELMEEMDSFWWNTVHITLKNLAIRLYQYFLRVDQDQEEESKIEEISEKRSTKEDLVKISHDNADDEQNSKSKTKTTQLEEIKTGQEMNLEGMSLEEIEFPQEENRIESNLEKKKNSISDTDEFVIASVSDSDEDKTCQDENAIPKDIQEAINQKSRVIFDVCHRVQNSNFETFEVIEPSQRSSSFDSDASVEVISEEEDEKKLSTETNDSKSMLTDDISSNDPMKEEVKQFSFDLKDSKPTLFDDISSSDSKKEEVKQISFDLKDSKTTLTDDISSSDPKKEEISLDLRDLSRILEEMEEEEIESSLLSNEEELGQVKDDLTNKIEKHSLPSLKNLGCVLRDMEQSLPDVQPSVKKRKLVTELNPTDDDLHAKTTIDDLKTQLYILATLVYEHQCETRKEIEILQTSILKLTEFMLK